jgi:hypothetical protein
MANTRDTQGKTGGQANSMNEKSSPKGRKEGGVILPETPRLHSIPGGIVPRARHCGGPGLAASNSPQKSLQYMKGHKYKLPCQSSQSQIFFPVLATSIDRPTGAWRRQNPIASSPSCVNHLQLRHSGSTISLFSYLVLSVFLLVGVVCKKDYGQHRQIYDDE